jgi:hypothetical protein
MLADNQTRRLDSEETDSFVHGKLGTDSEPKQFVSLLTTVTGRRKRTRG